MKPTTETTMTQTSTTDTGHICPKYEQAIQLLGKRWTGLLLYTLLEGPKRVVERVVYPQIPVRVEYKLTEKGRGLEPVVLAIRRWADKWVPSPDSSLTPSAQ